MLIIIMLVDAEKKMSNPGEAIDSIWLNQASERIEDELLRIKQLHDDDLRNDRVCAMWLYDLRMSISNKDGNLPASREYILP